MAALFVSRVTGKCLELTDHSKLTSLAILTALLSAHPILNLDTTRKATDGLDWRLEATWRQVFAKPLT